MYDENKTTDNASCTYKDGTGTDVVPQNKMDLIGAFWLVMNRISVMVSVLTSSPVDRRFDPQSGQTKDYRIGICCFSAKHAALRRKGQRLVGLESG